MRVDKNNLSICIYVWRRAYIVTRIEHSLIFEKLVFVLHSKILQIPIEHIHSIYSLESGLSFDSLCSVGILNILEVTAKTRFSKIAKRSTMIITPFTLEWIVPMHLCWRDRTQKRSSLRRI